MIKINNRANIQINNSHSLYKRVCEKTPRIGTPRVVANDTYLPIKYNNTSYTSYTELVHKVPVRNEMFLIANAPELVDNSNWTYEVFEDALDNDLISEVKIDTQRKQLLVVAKDGNHGIVQIPKGFSLDKLNDMIDHNVQVRYENNTTDTSKPNFNEIAQYALANILIPVALFWVMLSLIGSFMSSRGGANGIMSFGQSKAKFEETPQTGVTFDDVAGCDNAKRDLQEIVDFLKNPEKYTKLGAKIPKGCLLIGPSGTGKTLLAKAVAGEANVPFFSCSASAWIEMFVGVGSSRVRSLFKDAAAKAPCIIFIDEIDAVGKQRSSGSGFPGNDERDQTINQLLTEMDGFDGNKGIIVLAATNRPDVLDNALTRPGRFDRKIIVERPDYLGRIAILKVHTKNKPLDDDVDLNSIAKSTAGSSGADLENVANEAAILASRRNAEKVAMKDFDDALEKIALGEERRNAVMSEKQKRIVAIHEAGHTLVALKVGEYDNVRKVTIIPRGLAGGLTIFEPDQERVDFSLYSKDYLENQLCVALGGRVAEEVAFGKSQVTTGASSDLIQVMNIARRMVADFGFTERLGPIAWKSSSLFEEGTGYSQQTAYEIDEEIKAIANTAYARTYSILSSNADLLNKLADKLIEKETISGNEVKELLAL